MTTITELKTTEKEWNGKKSTSTTVVLSSGEKGYLDDKGSDKGLSQGDSVTFSLAVRKNSKGGDYNLLTLKKLQADTTAPPQAFSSNVPPPPTAKPQIHVGGKSAEDWRVETRLRLWEKLMDGFYDEKLDDTKVLLKMNEWKAYFDTEIAEVFGRK